MSTGSDAAIGDEPAHYDVLVIGGGINGAGVALFDLGFLELDMLAHDGVVFL
jgi:hypothetical protein